MSRSCFSCEEYAYRLGQDNPCFGCSWVHEDEYEWRPYPIPWSELFNEEEA
jgi:hypothetical protein